MLAADSPLILDSTGDFSITYKLTEDKDGTIKNTSGYIPVLAVSERYNAKAPVEITFPAITTTDGALGVVELTVKQGSTVHLLPALPPFPTGTTEPDWHKNSLLNLEPHKADYNYIYQIYLTKGADATKETSLIVRGLLAIRD